MRMRTTSVLLALLVAGCTPRPAAAPAPDPAAAREIIAILQESTVAWNRGDLEGFLRPYAPDATFVGADVVHGYAAIREFYRGSWFRGGAPSVNLAYRDIDVRPTGPNSALVVGHWVVSNKTTGEETRHGIFSLTWMRTPAGWRIVHDHSG
jgi:uncharacterized protein (TIGR02246 family)